MPYVEGGETPLHVYATNATIPPLNDWTHLNGKQEKQFEASPAELARAKQAYAYKHSRHEARQARHALFDTVIQVSSLQLCVVPTSAPSTCTSMLAWCMMLHAWCHGATLCTVLAFHHVSSMH